MPFVWTISAIYCYQRNCKCLNCYYDNFFKGSGHTCKLKEIIPKIIESEGLPVKTFQEPLESSKNNLQEEIISCIYTTGNITENHIASKLNISSFEVKKTIKYLLSLGIVTQKEYGGLILYSITDLRKQKKCK
jgi:predicted HTH transcriptional regulator